MKTQEIRCKWSSQELSYEAFPFTLGSPPNGQKRVTTLSPRFLLMAVVACCVLATSTSYAQIENFGSGGNAFTIEFVPIGNPGNVDDTTGKPNPAGKVDYLYNIGKYEVSRDMITKANAESGLGITLADMTSFGGNGVNRPATGMSWNESARFVNWLNTSTGGNAAYNFTTGGVNDDITPWTAADTLDYDAANPFRSKRTNYVLPSMDEWYKAAYYNPSSGMYGDYPSSDGLLPTAVASGTVDKTAVFNQLEATGPADITQAGGLSAYGIMGLGGNVYEWEETTIDLLNSSGSSIRGFRGAAGEARATSYIRLIEAATTRIASSTPMAPWVFASQVLTQPPSQSRVLSRFFACLGWVVCVEFGGG